MRVPSIGQPLDERRIVREGYRLAQRMLRDYQDPPTGIAALLGNLATACRQMMLDLYRALVRN